MTAGQSKKFSATKCKCGSTSHKRSTHKNYPLRNTHQTAAVHEASKAGSDDEDDDILFLMKMMKMFYLLMLWRNTWDKAVAISNDHVCVIVGNNTLGLLGDSTYLNVTGYEKTCH